MLGESYSLGEHTRCEGEEEGPADLSMRQREVMGDLPRRLIRALVEENVRVPFSSHVVATDPMS